jgi:hypothetical protein
MLDNGSPNSLLVTFTEKPKVCISKAIYPDGLLLDDIRIENLAFPPWFMLPNLLVHRPTSSLVGLTFDAGIAVAPVARGCCEILNSPAIRCNGPGGPWDREIYRRAAAKYKPRSTPWPDSPDLPPGAREDRWTYVEILWGFDEPDEFVGASLAETSSYYTTSSQPTPFDMNPENPAGEWLYSDFAHLRWIAQGVDDLQWVLEGLELKLPERFRFPVVWFEPLDLGG